MAVNMVPPLLVFGDLLSVFWRRSNEMAVFEMDQNTGAQRPVLSCNSMWPCSLFMDNQQLATSTVFS
jgi:hypothetical protein